MAPEQAQGNSVDHRVDLFSVGCVLYQMISGVSPFARKDVLSTLRALELETPELPTVRYPDTPGPLADLAMKLLEKKPENRPNSAQDVLEILQAIEKDMATGTTDATTVLASRFPTLHESQTRVAARRGFPMIPAAIVAGCLAVAAAYFFWQQPQWSTQNIAAEKKANDQGAKEVKPDVVAAAPDANKNDAQPSDPQSNPATAKLAPLPVADLLDESRKDFKINFELLNVKEEEGVRRFGEGQVRFKIEVDEDAYVGVWFKADDDSFKQFFPNEFDRDNHFQKGKVYEFPRNKDYTFEATPSKKLETFRVIASTKPWSWEPTNVQQGYRIFRDANEFNENLRGVVLKANPNTTPRISQVSIPVWVLPKQP
jgi:serine/threonine protein kinase